MDHTQQAMARLTSAGVRGIALTWVDNAGITRVKTVPTARLKETVRNGVGMSPVFDVYLVDDSMTDSPHVGGPDGDLRLVPDLDRLTVLAGQPGWAWAPVDRFQASRAPYPGCQRRFARRQMERAFEEFELELLMGFETEWVVGDGATTGRGPAYGMARLVELSDYLGELVEALGAQGVAPLQLHPEYAVGQFEVSVAPANPVAAADLAVLVRETVRAVSTRNGLPASFAPMAGTEGLGNGRHLHLSLWRDGKNLCRGGDGPFGMTADCEAFLAGVYRELPALMALGAPSPASYLRLRPSRWAGAYHCWGLENREAALRFVTGSPDDLGAANAEVKSFDGAANPYLVVGGVLAAGLAGLREELTLPVPVTGDPAHQPGQRRLPAELPEATRALADSAVLAEAMGEELLGAVVAVRRAEAELFAAAGPEELVVATRDRY
ncbi:glutamine synthetase [Streptomyces sp. 3MP-14]|uniref:Glutamine synthetase n=1 Tax=Streptomyces mimosae TaxID=2586635 RepID=A0A5N6ADT0_9ACTN|nr:MULTISPECIES: glutamine synthetase family protein [Streptomyces]KAB8166977.1 glutamine synthetase [Streptomyces mimosae]KAB8176918.1 glutamine synthetase [Streptomyces sp. 3MP-14]